MKTPPLLVGAALLFWGWQTDYFIMGAVMAAVLESSRFIKIRWELTNEDFSRIWMFCSLLFLATGAYALASNGPGAVSSWFTSAGFSGHNTAGAISAKTAVLLLRWMPMAFFLFMAAQTFSNREGIPLETISLILQRRWKKAQKNGKPVGVSRSVNVAYPYFIVCMFAASSHAAVVDNYGFFWGLCGLTAWALWPLRSKRFGLSVWAGAMCAAVLLGYGGQRGLLFLRAEIQRYDPQWLSRFVNSNFDPTESRTEIGQVGKIKTSNKIVIRLEPQSGNEAPAYLRGAAYRIYKSGAWYSGLAKDDFSTVPEEPHDSGRWPLVPGKTNGDVVNIACYLPGGKGLLPLPEESGLLEQLPAFLLQKNDVGAVRAEGPGLVIFNARYGGAGAMDAPPNHEQDIAAVPDKEIPALDQIISELHLEGKNRKKTLETVSQYFGTKFTYSLWQPVPRTRETNTTALSRFLLQKRSGHCEYFATATVLLLRRLGIPARYTVGYAVHESSGRKYVVRASDAHAWCRVWNERRNSWEDFDTTPGIWLETERKQRSSLQFLSDAWSRVEFEFSKFRWGQSNLRQYILLALVPVLALLFYQIVFRSGRKRAGQKSKASSNGIVQPGLDSEFYRLESELAKRGVVRQSSELPSVWLRRATTVPELARLNESLGRILALHYRHRFDPHGLNAADREALRLEVASCLAKMPAQQ